VAKQKKPKDPVVEQLEAIKRLLALSVIASGVKANSVAKVLGVSKATVSGMVPARLIKK
jgi:predicted transcriptional regulator